MSTSTVDRESFDLEEARAALDHADPNLLRMALLQLTGDPSLASMGVARGYTGPYVSNELDPEHHEEVRAKALAYLMQRTEAPLPPADKANIRPLMELFANRELSEDDFLFGYEELGFDAYPRDVGWSDKPAQDVLDKFHVTIIGAGFSGIAMAIQLDRLGIPYTIFDREQGPGGTWLINSYPGCRVDLVCFNYQFKFEKNYPWPSYFPTREECLEYLVHVARKYDVLSRCRFGAEVTAATWDEELQKWEISTRSADGATKTTRSNVIISGAGVFSTRNLPDIQGIERFQGAMFHTSRWDHGFDYRGKRVAVVGNGSSATQLMPELGEAAAQVTAFQRTPQWISPVENYHGKVAPEVEWLCANVPYYWNWQNYSAFLFSMQIQEFQEYEPGRQASGGVNRSNDRLRENLTKFIESKVGDKPELLAKVVPKSAPVGRRLVIDNGWYDALRRDNVELVTDRIERFTETGIVTADGAERSFDLIVLGTGFNTSKFLWPTQYVGRNAATLEALWAKDGPRSYLGITLPGFPNLFCMYGPNGQPRAAGLHSWMEAWTRYILTAVTAMVESGHDSVEVRQDVYDRYNDEVDRAGDKILWAQEGKGSYYVNAHGRSDLNIPFRAENYYAMIERPNMDDFILR